MADQSSTQSSTTPTTTQAPGNPESQIADSVQAPEASTLEDTTPTTASAPTAADASKHATSSGISNAKLLMWLFLGSECLLFGALISVYIFLYDRLPEGEIDKEIFDIPFTSVSSFILLMSSLTMVLALSGIIAGDMRRFRIWIATTALLGGLFIGGQIYEFTVFYSEGLGYTTSVFSSSFYSLTGFHGAHVTIGIIMLMSLLVMNLRGNLPKEKSEVVEIVGLYWHFVDIVWIVIFTVIYLFP